MKCLIPTEPNDKQAIVVKLALEKAGHEVTLMFPADQPTRQKNSMFVDVDHYRWQSIDRYDSILANDHDVVWWRCARKPHLPKSIAHPQDHSFIVRENNLFHDSLALNMAPNAWWVNRHEAARRANFKLLQLKTASDCGITIPTTLCSNDPDEIRRFVLQQGMSGVVYKPLSVDSGHANSAPVSLMTYMDLPGNQALQRAPGIFQTVISKQYELRVTCFGHYMVAAKLTPNQPLVVEPYALPDELATKLRLFMHQLGLAFGVFDVIVTPDRDYVFVELKEQGEFLWIEECNPDFNLLDIFVNFLVNQSIEFNWAPHRCQHAIAAYRDKIEPIFTENRGRHVCAN